MQKTIYPATIRGEVTAPPSKSVTQRAMLAAFMRLGRSVLHRVGFSHDEQAMLGIIQGLGAHTSWSAGHTTLTIDAAGASPRQSSFDFGESGLAIRMAAPVIAVRCNEALLTGRGSLLRRPMDWLETVLPQLGVLVETSHGHLPVRLLRRLQPRPLEVDGSVSSQFISGLLCAYAHKTAEPVTIRVRNAVSTPYLALTVEVLNAFGFSVSVDADWNFTVLPYQGFAPGDVLDYTIEADWSSAAMLLVMGATAGGDLTIAGLNPKSAQADRAIIQALEAAGAHVQGATTCTVRASQQPLRPFHFNAIDCPDLFPPLAVLAAACDGASVIRGIHRLAHKESNRARALQAEFGKMGITVELDEAQDTMIVHGGKPTGNVAVQSHGDHRVAMACAALALRADGPVMIAGAEAVAKSYPDFWTHLDKLT